MESFFKKQLEYRTKYKISAVTFCKRNNLHIFFSHHLSGDEKSFDSNHEIDNKKICFDEPPPEQKIDEKLSWFLEINREKMKDLNIRNILLTSRKHVIISVTKDFKDDTIDEILNIMKDWDDFERIEEIFNDKTKIIITTFRYL